MISFESFHFPRDDWGTWIFSDAFGVDKNLYVFSHIHRTYNRKFTVLNSSNSEASHWFFLRGWRQRCGGDYLSVVLMEFCRQKLPVQLFRSWLYHFYSPLEQWFLLELWQSDGYKLSPYRCFNFTPSKYLTVISTTRKAWTNTIGMIG